MSNIEHENSKLDSYFINDLNISFENKNLKKIIKAIVFRWI